MKELEYIKRNTGLIEKGISCVVNLLSEGATVPFIARYRKSMTGELNEVQIASIRDEQKKFIAIIARQQTILSAIEEQGKLSDELSSKIKECFDLISLDDIYLPYKQKRLTKGEKAKKMGLEPLAKMIMSQKGDNPFSMASRFVKGEIESEVDAIAGAKNIMAEWVSENAALRARLRSMFNNRALLSSKLVKGKELEAEKYRNYFDHSESINRCASHRFLAIYRANREGMLSLKVRPDEDSAMELIERFFVKGNSELSEVVQKACLDAYKRLLRPSLENEAITIAKEKADKDAINVFSKNLRQLLLAPPLGAKRILAIDPGYKSGCKVVCIDETGALLTNVNIYPHPPQKETSKAQSKLFQLVQAYKIDAIAIGDGTAGRETENLVKHIRFDRDVDVFVVNEDGASIYSASSIARKEFPNFDITVRGSVSIGRRLMDPLAELVKIDPKSVGVGQYQHEVNQTRLKEALDDVVISCVNTVGVDVNTASEYLLSYISGLGPTLAENIVAYRKENGRINSREELKKIKRLGSKAFEQAAGFIRIKNGKNPLDNSSVHPESYAIVKAMAKKINTPMDHLIGEKEKVDKLDWKDFSTIDKITFDDVIKELKKPGLDPRKKVKVLEFDGSIKSIADLKQGLKLNGIVTNVTNFGAFVNIGIKENGLIHKSNLADVYVEDPSDFIALHEHVEVEVVEVDVERKRIGLKKV
ncbi:MAG: RNA-binding transcriptional accessory protein [Flavobacteriales bacterium]|nr:RNA-binding transcriptional accessory protein [Flavobacteriales bacterium]